MRRREAVRTKEWHLGTFAPLAPSSPNHLIRAGWVSTFPLEWLRGAVQPPGLKRTHEARRFSEVISVPVSTAHATQGSWQRSAHTPRHTLCHTVPHTACDRPVRPQLSAIRSCNGRAAAVRWRAVVRQGAG